jgi:hypothetical protein
MRHSISSPWPLSVVINVVDHPFKKSELYGKEYWLWLAEHKRR